MPASSDAYTVRTSDIIILQGPESDEPLCLSSSAIIPLVAYARPRLRDSPRQGAARAYCLS